MRDVFWSRDALADLDRTMNYIAADNPRAALSVIDRIEATGNRLGEMATGHPGRVSGTYERGVVGLPYIIAYSLQEHADGTERIFVLRVIHGARDWPEGEWPKP